MGITRAPSTLANQAKKKKSLTPEQQTAAVKETPMSLINVGGKDFPVDRATALNAATAQAKKAQEDQLIADARAMSPQEMAKRLDFLRATGSEIIPSQPEVSQPQQSKSSNVQGGLISNLPSPVAAGLGKVATTEGGAAVGATIGSVVPGVGTAIGAGVGAVVGTFIKGITSKLKQDAEQNIQATYDTLPANSKNARLLIIDAKTDPERSYKAFWAQLNAIDAAYSDTKLESQKSLNAFLAVDTKVEIAGFERFYAPGGLREVYINRMNAVMLNPRTDVSDLIYPSDLEGQ